MECPACENQLQQITVSGIEVDVCKGGCGGIWFDNFELKKFDEKHEANGQELLEIERDENIVVDNTQKRKCPKCDDMVMMRHFYSTKKEVEIDECPQCGGFWLDAGELERIRNLYKNEAEKQEATKKYFSEILTVNQIHNEAETERIRMISSIFRFISPSFYFGRRY